MPIPHHKQTRCSLNIHQILQLYKHRSYLQVPSSISRHDSASSLASHRYNAPPLSLSPNLLTSFGAPTRRLQNKCLKYPKKKLKYVPLGNGYTNKKHNSNPFNENTTEKNTGCQSVSSNNTIILPQMHFKSSLPGKNPQCSLFH